MRRMPPRQPPMMRRWITRRCGDAIAALVLAVLVGATLKVSPPTKAGSVGAPLTPAQQPQASTAARSVHRQQQERQIRPENFDVEQVPLTAANEHHWRHLLWTTAVVHPEEAFVAKALNQILSLTTRDRLSDAQMRIVDQAMKVATQLYLSHPDFYGVLGQRFIDTVEQSRDPEWVAVALSGLRRGQLAAPELQRLSQLARSRFPLWALNVHLQTTLREIEQSHPALPPLADLLTWEIAPRQLHLYVLCRRDRRVLCQTLLKDREGRFVTQGEGLWSVPLLLESVHRLSWNFTRGQTPQGIFRIEGVVPQPDDEYFRAYGQFDLVNLYVPFEAGAQQFLPNRPGAFRGSLADYQALLPPSWRTYVPMQQSFWAGKAGRSLFRIHGSGEAVDFFQGKDQTLAASYDWNPTIGCLSAREIYNEKGQLMQADMPKILQALRMVGGPNFAGYLLVVEVPGDDRTPVALDELAALVKSVPARSQGKSRPPQVVRRAGVRRSATAVTKARTGKVQSGKVQSGKVSSGKMPSGQVQSGQVPSGNTPSRSPHATPPDPLKPLPIAY